MINVLKIKDKVTKVFKDGYLSFFIPIISLLVVLAILIYSSVSMYDDIDEIIEAKRLKITFNSPKVNYIKQPAALTSPISNELLIEPIKVEVSNATEIKYLELLNKYDDLLNKYSELNSKQSAMYLEHLKMMKKKKR